MWMFVSMCFVVRRDGRASVRICRPKKFYQKQCKNICLRKSLCATRIYLDNVCVCDASRWNWAWYQNSSCRIIINTVNSASSPPTTRISHTIIHHMLPWHRLRYRTFVFKCDAASHFLSHHFTIDSCLPLVKCIQYWEAYIHFST